MEKANKIENQYTPDYAVHPGEILQEYLHSYKMSQSELSNRAGMAPKTINQIIKGGAAITPDTAIKLERVFNRPAHLWNNLQQQYNEHLARQKETKQLQAHIDWLKQVPVNTMVKFGYIKKHSDKTMQLKEVLNFFAVASPAQCAAAWRQYKVAYRQAKGETDDTALMAWLRHGDIQAQQMECDQYDDKKFREVLDEARSLTLQSPKDFQPTLTRMCAQAGVAVIFTPELPKTKVSGATRWIRDRAIIQLSLHYKSNDQLWFSFFHEAGHILLHGHKDIFIEGKSGLDKEKEKEADKFACDKLIPPAKYKNFVAQSEDNFSKDSINKFAKSIGIAPGIVVGRLQHEKYMSFSRHNDLKKFYRWAT